MDKVQQVVKRPNETIGIVPNNKQRITHLVRRLYSVILLFSQKQGDQEEYAAVLSDMLEAANSPGSNRTQVKAILRDIRAIGIDWNVRDGDREIWKNVGLIEEPGLIDGKGKPTIVTWKLPKIIRTRLLDPRGFFTKISLEMMTRLRSGASIALYEICCQYVSNDHGKGEGGLTNRASIAQWMPRLTGSREADYEYKFLKRDVILTAIKEINEITDLRVELIEHKVGRKVGELQFRVFRKQIADSSQTGPGRLPPESPPATPVTRTKASTVAPLPVHVQRIVALGASIATAKRIFGKHEDDIAYLLRHLDYVEARVRNTTTTPLVNKVAFLQQALTQGYADGAGQAPEATPPARVILEPVAPVPSPAMIERQQQALARRAAVWSRFQAMSNDAEKAGLVEEFLQQTNATLKTFYRKNGVNNMIVKASLTDWLITQKDF